MCIKGPGQLSLQRNYELAAREAFGACYFGKRESADQSIGKIGNLNVVVSMNYIAPVISERKKPINLVLIIPAGPAELMLPVTIGAKISVLQKGEKCLFYLPFPESGTRQRSRVWFAGTDDGSHFVTEIEPGLYNTFTQFGENVFLEALKPELTKRLEKHFGTHARRQGDMWVSIFPYSTWSCAIFDVPYFSDFESDKLLRKEKMRLFGTRHAFSGQYRELSRDIVLAANGVLQAPNHPTMHLNGVHIIQQNAGLVLPRFAD
ncbi:MAG: hypothetical protein HY445_00210 [Candidatus Niyogibacteria bacterium]|nr:hypothetical protein [Candidatus Niyogibacteria bacterium]